MANGCALIANSNSGWAFGGGVPMGSAGLPNPSRQMGGNVSFAQSLSGSQPQTPLDLSYVNVPSSPACTFTSSCHWFASAPSTLLRISTLH